MEAVTQQEARRASRKKSRVCSKSGAVRGSTQVGPRPAHDAGGRSAPDILRADLPHVSILEITDHKRLHAGAKHVYGNLTSYDGGTAHRICVLRYVDESDILAAHDEHEKGWKIGDRTGRMSSVAALLRATLAQLREGRSMPCACCLVRSERSGCLLAVCAVESWRDMLATRNRLSWSSHVAKVTGGAANATVRKLRALDERILATQQCGEWCIVPGGNGSQVENLLKGTI